MHLLKNAPSEITFTALPSVVSPIFGFGRDFFFYGLPIACCHGDVAGRAGFCHAALDIDVGKSV
jgi:hypothetical protein